MKRTKNHQKPYRYGFALAGGAAKCIASLGALEAFAEKGVKPEILSGTSAGAIAGALIADGYSPREILGLLKGLTLRDFMDVTIPNSGVSKTTKLHAFLGKHLRARTFEELKVPLSVTATDFYLGKTVHFSTGPLIAPVVASCCVPILFVPEEIGESVYVDGGLFQNLPASTIRDKCEKLIGLEVNPLRTTPHEMKMRDMIDRTITLIVRSTTRKDTELCDVFLCPQELENYSMADVNRSKDIFEIGYREAEKYLSDNPKVL